MAKLTVYDAKGASVGSVEIEPTDLAPRINKQLLHDAVVMYEANLRQGTFATKSRATGRRFDEEDVSPKRYGQCPSRFATQRYSSWRRSYFRQEAARFWLSVAAQGVAVGHADGAWHRRSKDDQVTVIDDLKFSAPKTRDMAAILKAVKCNEHKTVLVATAAHDANVYKSVRNIDGVSMSPVAELNALTVLKPRRLLFTKAALEWVKEQAKSGKGSSGSRRGRG